MMGIRVGGKEKIDYYSHAYNERETESICSGSERERMGVY